MSTNNSCGDPQNFNLNVAGAGLVLTNSLNGATWGKLDLDLPSNNDFKDLKSRIEKIEKRLAILHPNEALQARFPSLQEAYEAYKIIERLVDDGS